MWDEASHRAPSSARSLSEDFSPSPSPAHLHALSLINKYILPQKKEKKREIDEEGDDDKGEDEVEKEGQDDKGEATKETLMDSNLPFL